MGVRFYDEAITAKISNWIKDPNMCILKPDESTRLFEIKAHENADKPLTLPLIAISRDKTIEIIEAAKQTKTYDGYGKALNITSTDPSAGNNVKPATFKLNAIPIRIGYQIDIYTKGMEEADEYLRNFIFNFINYPKLVINLPYNGLNLPQESNITLDSAVNDNSDIKEHLFADEFVRFTIKLSIEDAYLFSIPSKEPYTIDCADSSLEYKLKNDKDWVKG